MTIEKSASTADFHLRTFNWASRPRLQGDSILAMEYFFDWCLDNRSSAKLLGDIFHTLTPLPEFVAPIFRKLDEMQEACLPVYYIQGNHDLNSVPWLSLHKWPVNMHNEEIEIPEAGMYIKGFQNSCEDDVSRMLNTLPDYIDTLVMHQSEVKAMPFAPEFCLDDVPSTVKNILIGHIHVPQEYDHGTTRLWYPGSPSRTAMNQGGQRSFLCEEAGAEGTEIKRIRMPGRGFYSIKIPESNPDVLDDIEEALAEIAQTDDRDWGLEPIVHIEYPPALAEKAHQRFMIARDTLDIYTWLDVIDPNIEDMARDGTLHEHELAGVPPISSVISDFVDQETPKSLLLQIYEGGDTGEILRSGLEEALT